MFAESDHKCGRCTWLWKWRIFPTQSAQGVTDSVIAFINNLDKVPLEPLTTGAISVPYDALNPKNLQEYGYLRAFEPNPANTYLTWRGNLKKYHVVLSGTNAGAFEANTGGLVYNATGAFRTGTKDYWNSSNYNDGGKVFLVVHMQKFLYQLLDKMKHVMKKEISQNIITQYKLKSATYLLMFPLLRQMVA